MTSDVRSRIATTGMGGTIPRNFLRFDDAGNRKELWRLLDKLGDGVAAEVGCARRRRFLEWACRQSVGVFGNRVEPSRDTVGLTGEVYADVVALAAMYGFDLESAVLRLDAWIRRLR